MAAIVLRPLPVLHACPGCARGGEVARQAAALLEQAGEAEWRRFPRAATAGPEARWPLVVLDGCPARCALAALGARGVTPQQCFMLAGMDAESAARLVRQEP